MNPVTLAIEEHPKYVMRITGDSTEGKVELDNFIDPGEPISGDRNNF